MLLDIESRFGSLVVLIGLLGIIFIAAVGFIIGLAYLEGVFLWILS